MKVHSLPIGVETLHGHFSNALAPVLTIDPGDVVVGAALDSGWGELVQANPFERPTKLPGRDPIRDPGHALCGPIRVRGAKPGMTLEMRIRDLRPGRWGWSGAGGYPSGLNIRLGLADPPECVMRWSIDPVGGVATNQAGMTVAIRPFLGILGMPPAEPGVHSTFPPRSCGGNIDCRALVPGTTLLLPIACDGALFSFGDGHAVQGDGEVAGPALECPMEFVELEFGLRARQSLAMPRAETPDALMAFGLDEDLDEAVHQALEGVLDIIQEECRVERKEALALASLVVDLGITQIVNGTKGAHATIARHRLPGMCRGRPPWREPILRDVER